VPPIPVDEALVSLSPPLSGEPPSTCRAHRLVRSSTGRCSRPPLSHAGNRRPEPSPTAASAVYPDPCAGEALPRPSIAPPITAPPRLTFCHRSATFPLSSAASAAGAASPPRMSRASTPVLQPALWAAMQSQPSVVVGHAVLCELG
jgi:hypothetical protein